MALERSILTGGTFPVPVEVGEYWRVTRVTTGVFRALLYKYLLPGFLGRGCQVE